MRPGRSAGGADGADDLALGDDIAGLHVDARQVQHRRMQPAAMIEDDDIAFQAERPGGQSHDAGDGRADGGAAGGGDIHAAVIAGRHIAIDTLRAKMRGNAAGCRPAEPGLPEWQRADFNAGAAHLRGFGGAQCFPHRIGRRVRIGPPHQPGGQAIDHPLPRCHRYRAAGAAAIPGHPFQLLAAGGITVDAQHEAAIGCDMHGLAAQAQLTAAGGQAGNQQLALHGDQRLRHHQRQRRGRPCDGRTGQQQRQGQPAHQS